MTSSISSTISAESGDKGDRVQRLLNSAMESMPRELKLLGVKRFTESLGYNHFLSVAFVATRIVDVYLRATTDTTEASIQTKEKLQQYENDLIKAFIVGLIHDYAKIVKTDQASEANEANAYNMDESLKNMLRNMLQHNKEFVSAVLKNIESYAVVAEAGSSLRVPLPNYIKYAVLVADLLLSRNSLRSLIPVIEAANRKEFIVPETFGIDQRYYNALLFFVSGGIKYIYVLAPHHYTIYYVISRVVIKTLTDTFKGILYPLVVYPDGILFISIKVVPKISVEIIKEKIYTEISKILKTTMENELENIWKTPKYLTSVAYILYKYHNQKPCFDPKDVEKKIQTREERINAVNKLIAFIKGDSKLENKFVDNLNRWLFPKPYDVNYLSSYIIPYNGVEDDVVTKIRKMINKDSFDCWDDIMEKSLAILVLAYISKDRTYQKIVAKKIDPDCENLSIPELLRIIGRSQDVNSDKIIKMALKEYLRLNKKGDIVKAIVDEIRFISNIITDVNQKKTLLNENHDKDYEQCYVCGRIYPSEYMLEYKIYETYLRLPKETYFPRMSTFSHIDKIKKKPRKLCPFCLLTALFFNEPPYLMIKYEPAISYDLLRAIYVKEIKGVSGIRKIYVDYLGSSLLMESEYLASLLSGRKDEDKRRNLLRNVVRKKPATISALFHASLDDILTDKAGYPVLISLFGGPFTKPNIEYIENVRELGRSNLKFLAYAEIARYLSAWTNLLCYAADKSDKDSFCSTDGRIKSLLVMFDRIRRTMYPEIDLAVLGVYRSETVFKNIISTSRHRGAPHPLIKDLIRRYQYTAQIFQTLLGGERMKRVRAIEKYTYHMWNLFKLTDRVKDITAHKVRDPIQTALEEFRKRYGKMETNELINLCTALTWKKIIRNFSLDPRKLDEDLKKHVNGIVYTTRDLLETIANDLEAKQIEYSDIYNLSLRILNLTEYLFFNKMYSPPKQKEKENKEVISS